MTLLTIDDFEIVSQFETTDPSYANQLVYYTVEALVPWAPEQTTSMCTGTPLCSFTEISVDGYSVCQDSPIIVPTQIPDQYFTILQARESWTLTPPFSL